MEKDIPLQHWFDWDNVACRLPIKTELEKQAGEDGRSTTNFLEQILCNALKIKVPIEVRKRK